MEEKKMIGLRMETDLIKKIKIHCLENNLSVNSYIVDLVKKDLKIK